MLLASQSLPESETPFRWRKRVQGKSACAQKKILFPLGRNQVSTFTLAWDFDPQTV